MAGRDMQAYDFGQSQPMVIDQNSVWFDHINSQARPRTSAVAQPKKKGNSLLKALLSIGGGVAGGAIGTLIAPGVGTAIGAGLGSGLGTAVGRAGGGESVLGEGGAQEIALDTLLGGAFGGAGKAAKAAARTGGVMTKGATKVAQEGAETVGRKGLAEALSGIRGTGEDFVGAATGIKYGARAAGKDPLTRAGAAELQNILRNQGVKMTGPRTVQRGVETAIGKAGEEVGQAFGRIKQPISTVEVGKLRDAIFKRAKSEVGIQDKNAAFGRIDTMLSEIGSNPTTDDILGLSRKFTANAGKYSQSNNKALSAQLNQIAKEESQKFLANIDSGAGKQAQKLYAQLNNAQEIMQGGVRGVEGKALNLGGNQLLGGPIASVKNRVGNTMIDFVDAATAGGAVRKATSVNMLKPLAIRQTGREFLTGGFSPDMEGAVDPTMQDPTMAADMAGTEDAPVMGYSLGPDGTIEPITEDAVAGSMNMSGDPYADTRAQIQQAMLDDMQLTGGENVSKLATVLKAFEAPEGTKLSQSDKTKTDKLNSAMRVVDSLRGSFSSAGGAQGFAGYGSSLMGALKINDEAAAYNDMRNGFLAQISKSLGESGVLTDQDIQRVRALVPALEDTPGQADIKWRELMSILNGAMPGTDTRFANQEVY